jgi:hypothetical protein
LQKRTLLSRLSPPTHSLPQNESILTFEGQKSLGAPAIVQKLTSLPFQVEREREQRSRALFLFPTSASSQPIFYSLSPFFFCQSCKHHVSSIDAQPSVAGGIMVFVTGQLLPEGESNALKFSQVFHLAPVGGSFVVTNDLFRLNYA